LVRHPLRHLALYFEVIRLIIYFIPYEFPSLGAGFRRMLANGPLRKVAAKPHVIGMLPDLTRWAPRPRGGPPWHDSRRPLPAAALHREDLAGHEPVEQHSHRREVLFHCGQREPAWELLDEGRDGEGLGVREFLPWPSQPMAREHSGRHCKCGRCRSGPRVNSRGLQKASHRRRTRTSISTSRNSIQIDRMPFRRRSR
jgi:hypothetical protein